MTAIHLKYKVTLVVLYNQHRVRLALLMPSTAHASCRSAAEVSHLFPQICDLLLDFPEFDALYTTQRAGEAATSAEAASVARAALNSFDSAQFAPAKFFLSWLDQEICKVLTLKQPSFHRSFFKPLVPETKV
jgi:hypothetical protein